MDDLCGAFVESLSGRDKGRMFIITGIIDEKYVYYSDGRSRNLDKPKKKKLKHLRMLGRTDFEDVSLATNKQLREALSAFMLESIENKEE